MALLFFAYFLLCGFTTMLVDRCACGDYYTSITTFFVEDGQDCCEGEVASDVGYEAIYKPESGGVFKLIDLYKIDGNEAQNTCCH